jgi:hypothetical protein
VLLAAAIIGLGVFGVSGCTHSSPTLRLDGSARVPDDEGIATIVSRNRITLDGRRSYNVSRKFVSFSTHTLQVEPMAGRVGQYVLLGTSGKTATWMAGVSAVTQKPVPRAYYQGRLLRIGEQRRMFFQDGTVLRLAAKIPSPQKNQLVSAIIDIKTHAVTDWTSPT